MATDINSVVLVGRLTREAEFRTTTTGTAISRFSLAVNRRKRVGDKWEDEVSYIDIALWGKSAETLNPYLEKGRQVCVQGELRQNRWEQDGQARSKIEVVATNVELLGSSQGSANTTQRTNVSSSSNYQPRQNVQPQKVSSVPDMNGPEEFEDSDIPF